VPNDTTPICPRCGYDQSGFAAGWRDACPLEGTCSECGHAFAWADVFDPCRRDLPWLVEHAPGVRGLLRRILPTLARVLAARSYWKSVGVEVRVRLLPVVVMLAVVFAAVYLAGGVWFAASRYRQWTAPGPITALAYGTPTRADMLAAAAVNVLTYGVGEYWGPSPSGWVFEWSMVRYPWCLFVAGFHSGWAIMLVALPDTRRRARLRLAHVGRAWVTGLVCLAPVLVSAIGERVRADGGVVSEWVLDWSFLASLVWVPWWWWCALRVGWRVEGSILVWFLLLIVSVMVAMVSMAPLLVI